MGVKELFEQGKQKLYQIIDKGTSEIKKYSASSKILIYSKPMLGGFVSKQVFLDENSFLLLDSDLKNKDIENQTIIKFEDDDELYVIGHISPKDELKNIHIDGKTYSYRCYRVLYKSLNDSFIEETMNYTYHEITKHQQEVLNQIRKELENKIFAVKEKKEACFQLWQYFTECISYHLLDHYVMHTFVKIADDYIEDFSSRLLMLFA